VPVHLAVLVFQRYSETFEAILQRQGAFSTILSVEIPCGNQP